MPKVTEEHRQLMRQRIQQSALAVVRRKGLGSTSMNDIIREAGLSAGAIYGYFAGKDELLMAVAADLIDNRFLELERMQQQIPVPHPVDAVAALLGGVPTHAADDGVIVQIWGLAPVDQTVHSIASAWMAQFHARITSYVAAWLVDNGFAEADAQERAAAIAPIFIGLAQGYFVRGALAGAESLPAYADALTELSRWLEPRAS